MLPGLRRRRRMGEIEGQWEDVFEIAHSRGEGSVESFFQGIRFGFVLARSKSVPPALTPRPSELQLAYALADRAAVCGGQLSGEGLGIGLVSFLFECRGIGTRRSLRLAGKISDTIHNMMESKMVALEKELGIPEETPRSKLELPRAE